MAQQLDQQANDAFREKLREVMELEHLSWAELSRRSGVPVRTLGRIRSGDNGATLTMVKRIAKGLRRDPVEMLGGTKTALSDELETGFVTLLGVEDAKSLFEQVATAKRLGVYDHCTAAIHGILVTQIKRRR